MKQICPWVRIIVIMRGSKYACRVSRQCGIPSCSVYIRCCCVFDVRFLDPSERAWSHYQMTMDKHGTPAQLKNRGIVSGKSFLELITEDIHALRTKGITPDCSAQQFRTAYIDSMPYGHGSFAYVGRGLYLLQLKQWLEYFPKGCGVGVVLVWCWCGVV